MMNLYLLRYRKADAKAKNILDLVHCHLAGPIDPIAKEGFKYSISFVDDYSGLIIIYFLKNKNDNIKALIFNKYNLQSTQNFYY